MTIGEFLGALEVPATAKVKSGDDKVLFEALSTSAIFQIIGSYPVVNRKVTDANRVVVKVDLSNATV